MAADPIAFLNCHTIAVAGASNNRKKYGNIVFRALVGFAKEKEGRVVYPVHPALELVEGHTAFTDIRSLPTVPEAVSIITPPQVTQKIVDDAIVVGVKFIWMQPGAEHPDAILAAEAAGITVFANGPCILVALKTIGTDL